MIGTGRTGHYSRFRGQHGLHGPVDQEEYP
jgi:hypothetical protein